VHFRSNGKKIKTKWISDKTGTRRDAKTIGAEMRDIDESSISDMNATDEKVDSKESAKRQTRLSRNNSKITVGNFGLFSSSR